VHAISYFSVGECFLHQDCCQVQIDWINWTTGLRRLNINCFLLVFLRYSRFCLVLTVLVLTVLVLTVLVLTVVVLTVLVLPVLVLTVLVLTVLAVLDLATSW